MQEISYAAKLKRLDLIVPVTAREEQISTFLHCLNSLTFSSVAKNSQHFVRRHRHYWFRSGFVI
jgi:hypothetical protein